MLVPLSGKVLMNMKTGMIYKVLFHKNGDCYTVFLMWFCISDIQDQYPCELIIMLVIWMNGAWLRAGSVPGHCLFQWCDYYCIDAQILQALDHNRLQLSCMIPSFSAPLDLGQMLTFEWTGFGWESGRRPGHQLHQWWPCPEMILISGLLFIQTRMHGQGTSCSSGVIITSIMLGSQRHQATSCSNGVA